MSEEKHTVEVFLNAPQFLKYKKQKISNYPTPSYKPIVESTRLIFI